MELGRFSITRDEIMAFARLWDAQPFHLSDEAAAASPLKELSASGWHTLALIVKHLEEKGHAFQGAKAVKWLKPLLPGVAMSVRLENGSAILADATGAIVCEVVL